MAALKLEKYKLDWLGKKDGCWTTKKICTRKSIQEIINPLSCQSKQASRSESTLVFSALAAVTQPREDHPSSTHYLMASVERPSLCPWLSANSPRCSFHDKHTHKTQSTQLSHSHIFSTFVVIASSLTFLNSDTCQNHKPSHECNGTQPPHFCSKTFWPGFSVVTSLPTLSQSWNSAWSRSSLVKQ